MAKGEAAIKVLTNEDITYDQWNFHGHFQKRFNQYYCADLDNDGFSEIYIFYFKDDSVFMGAIQPYPNKKVLFKKKFVSTIKKRDGNIDYMLEGFKLTDINNNGFDELLFYLRGGFSRQPRSIFIYNHQSCSFTASKSTGTYFGYMVISDLNNDSKQFIAAYFMDIDNNKDRLVFYEANAKEYSSITFELTPEERKKNSLFINPMNINNKSTILIGIIDGYFVMYNEKLEPLKIKTELENANLIFSGDLNNEGIEEFVFRANTNEYIIILDSKLKNPVWIKSNILTHSQKPYKIGIKHNNINKPDELFIKAEDNIYLYAYSLDYFHYLVYPLWILIYGIVVFILWFSLRIQLIQAKRK